MSAARAIRPLVAGNWKMNGLKASLADAIAVRDRIASAPGAAAIDVMICPPATLVASLGGGGQGLQADRRRAGLPRQAVGRPYGRCRGRDAC